MVLHLEIEQEADGRWIAEITDLPGVMAYGVTRPDAVARVQALALRALADRMEHGEAVPEFLSLAFQPV
jgi:predicted RNase H-like HicB family nuclease